MAQSGLVQGRPLWVWYCQGEWSSHNLPFPWGQETPEGNTTSCALKSNAQSPLFIQETTSVLIWSLRTGRTERAAAEGIPPSDTGLYGGAPHTSWAHGAPRVPFMQRFERLGANIPLAPPAARLTGLSGRLEPAPLCPALQNLGGAFGLLLSRGPEGPPEGAVAGTQGSRSSFPP